MYAKALKIVISPIIFNGSAKFFSSKFLVLHSGGSTRYNLTAISKGPDAGINTKLYQKQNRPVMFRKWSEGMAGRLIIYNVYYLNQCFLPGLNNDVLFYRGRSGFRFRFLSFAIFCQVYQQHT
jgi:hypothetical protein